MKKLVSLICALGASMSAFADSSSTTVQNWEVDYSGKPPFKRKLVSLNVADVAQLEAVETEVVTTTDFSGKPPFNRNAEKLIVVDNAMAEQVDADDSTTRRGRPPFKRN